MMSATDDCVKAFLDRMAEGDREGMFDLMYPGAMSRNDIGIMDELMEYCPVTKEYQLKRTSYYVTSQVGTTTMKTVRAFYDLNFGAGEYLIFVEYVKTESDCGFSSMRVISREEYESADGR